MPDTDGARISARVLGSFGITVDGRALGRADWQRLSAERLVKLLFIADGHRVSREVAVDTLWPEAAPETGRANLRKALHFARRALGIPEAIEADGPWIRLDPALIELDLDRLSAAYGALDGDPSATAEPGRGAETALATVLELGARTLLPDDAYEDWLAMPRERLQGRWQHIALAAAERAIAANQAADAHRILERILDRDPTDEAAHRQLIHLYAGQGRHHAARRQFELCRRALLEGLDAEPSPETVEALRDAELQPMREHARPSVSTTAPLVGRGRELQRVESLFDRVDEGRPAALVVSGPTGVGKTRVLEAVREYAAGAGWRELSWQATEATRAVAFGPFATGLAGLLDAADVEAWPEPERSAAATLLPGLSVRARLAFADRSALVVSAASVLARAAVRAPLLVMIDDVAWLDDASINVLASIGSIAPRSRILVAVACRDDEPISEASAHLLDRLRRDGALDLRLEPLMERDIEPLLLGHLGGEAVSQDLVTLLYRQCRGNPLFCLEIARAARTRGAVHLERDRWAIAAGEALEQPPESVRIAVAARLRGVPPPAVEVLRVAALLGPDVTYQTLAVVLPGVEGALVEALDGALASGLIVERDRGYAFAHPLYRAAVEAGAGPARRADARFRIARALAGAHDDETDEVVEALARASSDPAPVAEQALMATELGVREARGLAVAFGLAAAARARLLLDRDTAVRLYERALAIWDGLPEIARRRHGASAAYVALAELRVAAGDEPGAEAAFRSAAASARTHDEVAFAYERFTWLPYRHGDFHAAISLAEEALARLPDDAAVPRALVRSEIGWCLGRLHRFDEAVASLDECLAALVGAADGRYLALVLDRRGMMLQLAGRGDEALASLHRALAVALEGGDARDELVRMHLGAALTRMHRAGEARPHVARALELTHQMGEWYLEAVAAWTAAEMEDALGDIAAAGAMRERELALLTRIGGNPHNEALAHAHLAHLALRAGEGDRAAREAELARSLASADPEPGYAARIEAALHVERWSELQTG